MAQGTGDVKLDIEIVGLVQDAKYSEVKQEVPPLFFRPYRQAEQVGREARVGQLLAQIAKELAQYRGF